MILFLARSPARTSTQGLGSSPWSPAEQGRNLPEPPFLLDFTKGTGCERRDKQEVIDTKPTEHFTIQKKGFCHCD